MMNDKKQKHCGSDPFMSRLTYHSIGHKEQKRCRQQYINTNFNSLYIHISLL